MYIQDLIKSFVMFCIVLLVCMPIAISVEVTPFELPFTEEAMIVEEGDIFGEGEFADFALNVKYYEPRPLTSSTIEKGNAPIYVHLMGIAAVPMSVPKIRSMSVRETGTNVLTGGVRFVRPVLFDWDNFGYIIVRLKQIKKEADVPERIVANLTARITYDVDIIPGLIGGVRSLVLGESDVKKLRSIVVGTQREEFDLSLVEKEGHRFFGGYIHAVSIGKNSVRFIVWNKVGRPEYITVSKDIDSRAISLIRSAKRPQDYVRIRIDDIEYDEKKDKRKVKITLLAGRKTGWTDINFKLNIPVDKRPFDLTTKEIYDHMEWTNKTIAKLDRALDNVNKYVDWFYSACLISAGLAILGRFVGIGGAIGGEAAETGKKELEKIEKPEGTEDLIDILKREESGRAVAAILDITGKAVSTSTDIIIKLDGIGLPDYNKDGKIDEKDVEYGRSRGLLSEEQAKKLRKEVTEIVRVFEESRTIYTDNFKGENLIVVPIRNVNKLSGYSAVQTYIKANPEDKDRIYAAYNDKDDLTFYVRNGREMDGGNEKLDPKNVDSPILTYKKGTREYDTFTTQMRAVRNARLAGRDNVELFGFKYKLKTKNLLQDEAALNCDEFMSPGQCKLIFNFCDPVICPRSRCNYGGRGRLDRSVQESGLGASVFACLHNFPKVIVPVCLTGIQASLENIKSYLLGYQRCLQIKLKEGRSVGFCDRARSVFICEIIWRHVLDPLIQGMSMKMTRARKGGGEYIKGTAGPVARSKKVVDYFVQDYTKEIVASYKGRITKEIGSELCQSAIVGKFPDFGELLKDIAEGGKPTQYTAQFEEHPYSKAAGTSRYYGYYHIYVGSPTETVNYFIYLKDCGKITKLDLNAKGQIKGGDFADETFEQIGPSGCKHICVNINGEEQCAFGKMVSTSSAIQNRVDKFVVQQAGRQITLERECVSTYEAYLGASVNRQCALVKPGDYWIKAGTCKTNEQDDRSKIPNCWVEIKTRDKQMVTRIAQELCGRDKVCTRNQNCIVTIDGHEAKVSGTTISNSKNVCCENGKCVDKPFVKALENLVLPWTEEKVKEWKEKIGLSYPEDKELLDNWYEKSLKLDGNIDYHGADPSKGRIIGELIERKANNVYYYIALRFLYDADYENAKKVFNKIDEEKKESFLLIVEEKDLKKFFEEYTTEVSDSKDEKPKEPEKPGITIKGITPKSSLGSLIEGDKITLTNGVTYIFKRMEFGTDTVTLIFDKTKMERRLDEKIKDIPFFESVERP